MLFWKKEETTKTDKVLNHLLKKGSITSWEAIKKYKATRISDIIYRLRKYYDIHTEKYTVTDRYGNKTSFAKYVYDGKH